MDPESLGGKRLVDYDVIVAMEGRHRDYVLSLCPECGDKVVVWNVKDSYFLEREDAWKVYEQIKEKVIQLAKLQWSPKCVRLLRECKPKRKREKDLKHTYFYCKASIFLFTSVAVL